MYFSLPFFIVNKNLLVVVVSEETGAVSVASGGTLERNLSIGEVHETLGNFLRDDSSESGKSFNITEKRAKCISLSFSVVRRISKQCMFLALCQILTPLSVCCIIFKKAVRK